MGLPILLHKLWTCLNGLSRCFRTGQAGTTSSVRLGHTTSLLPTFHLIRKGKGLAWEPWTLAFGLRLPTPFKGKVREERMQPPSQWITLPYLLLQGQHPGSEGMSGRSKEMGRKGACMRTCVCVCACGLGRWQEVTWGRAKIKSCRLKILAHLATARGRHTARGRDRPCTPVQTHLENQCLYMCVHTCVQMNVLGTIGSRKHRVRCFHMCLHQLLIKTEGQWNKHTIEKCKRKYHLKKKNSQESTGKNCLWGEEPRKRGRELLFSKLSDALKTTNNYYVHV